MGSSFFVFADVVASLSALVVLVCQVLRVDQRITYPLVVFGLFIKKIFISLFLLVFTIYGLQGKSYDWAVLFLLRSDC